LKIRISCIVQWALGHVTPNRTHTMNLVVMKVNIQATVVFMKRYGHNVRVRELVVANVNYLQWIDFWKMLNYSSIHCDCV